MVDDIGTVYRDFNNINDPSSGDYEPEKARIRALLRSIRSLSGQAITKGTLAELTAVTPPTENYMGVVLDDPDPTNNGYYSRVAAAWVWQRGFPDTFAQVTLAGTANAQTGTVAAGVNPADVLVFFATVGTDNTGPMTLSHEGETLRDVVNAAGNALSAGEWTGTVLYFVNGDGDYQLLFDAGAAASAAASASAADADRIAAELARDQAQAAASSVSPTEFPNIATAEALTPISAPDFIRTAGYTAAGDGGGALYKKVASEPSHAGKFSITLSDGVTTVWYEIAETVVRPEMFGAVIDAGSDQQAVLQGMLDTGIREVYLPGGVWRSDSTLTRSDDISICGPGTLDFSNGNGQLLISGSLTQIDDLSANVTKHSQTLEWATDQGLAAQDIVLGYNPTDYSWGSRRAEYRDGFMFRIHSMDGSNGNVYGLAVDAYTAADFDIYKMTAPRVRVEGVTFIGGDASSLSPLRLKNCQASVITGVRGSGGIGGLIEVDQCFGVDIDCTTPLNNSPFVNDEYGIVIANSHYVNVKGGSPVATRHAVSIGGYGVVGAIPNRYINISGMSLMNNGLGVSVSAADIHGNSDFVTYDNCTMIGGPGGGRNIALRGCTIFASPGSVSGEAVYGAEIVGGFFAVENCTIISEGDGEAFGYINLIPLGPGNGTNRPVETHMRDDLDLIVRNLTLITPNAGDLAKAVTLRAQNADKQCNVTIDGIRWIAPQGYCFFVADDSVLAAFPSDGIIVDNVNGPAGVYLVAPTTHISSVPTREMTQTVAEVVACTSGQSSSVGTGVTFRYPYSRVPELVGAGFRSTDGAAKQTWGNQFLTAWAYSVTATTARMAAGSVGAAFASTENVRISGTFGLRSV